MATADEISNRFIAVRHWSVGDLAANYLGVVCVGILPLWQLSTKSRPASDLITAENGHELTVTDDAGGPRNAMTR